MLSQRRDEGSCVLIRLLAFATLLLAVHAPPARLVSLAPSLTEDLFALGAGSRVVGVSAYTDYPPAARALPVVATASAIDAERIVALHPDLVVGIAAQQRLTADVRRAGLSLMLLPDDSYASIFEDLRRLGEATGRSDRARALIARLQARTAALRRSVPRGSRRPSVFVVLGTAPIYTVGQGSYIAQLIALAGGRNAAADVRAPYARYSADALIAHEPDVIVADPTIGLQASLARPPWNALRAVREHHVYELPDPALLERPGPRYNDGLAWLIARLREARAS